MKELLNKFREYLDYIEEHYNNVQKAWALINEKCQNDKFRFIHDDFVWNIIDAEVKAHDLSKFSAEEFTQYRQFFSLVQMRIRTKTYLNKRGNIIKKKMNIIGKRGLKNIKKILMQTLCL